MHDEPHDKGLSARRIANEFLAGELTGNLEVGEDRLQRPPSLLVRSILIRFAPFDYTAFSSHIRKCSKLTGLREEDHEVIKIDVNHDCLTHGRF